MKTRRADKIGAAEATGASGSPAALLFEDVEIGASFATGSVLLDAKSMKKFATAYDPQPIHLSVSAAKASMLGVLMASGWHVLCASMRLIVDAAPLGETPMLGHGIDGIRFHRPVLPDTEILVCGVFRSKRVSASKPQRGYVMLHSETLDANSGALLVSQDWRLVLPTRAGEAERAAAGRSKSKSKK